MKAAIKMATAKDIDLLIKARFDFFADQAWDISTGQRPEMETALRQYFTWHLNTSFYAALIGAQNEIASVAFLAITEKPAGPPIPTGRMGTILNVLTYPKHRKKGYATKAVETLIRIAKENGVSYIELSATAAGAPLYRKLGFKEPGPAHFTEMRLSLL